MTALLSGVLARARAVASSLCVMGRGPVAPLWPSETGRIPAEPISLLGAPAGLPWYKHPNGHHGPNLLVNTSDSARLTDWKSSSSSDMPSNMKPPARTRNLPFVPFLPRSKKREPAPHERLTRHIAVGTGRDVARGAAAGLRRHAARHRVQYQDDGVDEGRVGTDQPATDGRRLRLARAGVVAPNSTESSDSQIQHARVCELHKEVFVLQDPWMDTQGRQEASML